MLRLVASGSFCESDSVLQFWRSGKHWTRRRMGMRFPKNSRTTIPRLMELKLYILKSRPVQNLISQRDTEVVNKTGYHAFGVFLV